MGLSGIGVTSRVVWSSLRTVAAPEAPLGLRSALDAACVGRVTRELEPRAALWTFACAATKAAQTYANWTQPAHPATIVREVGHICSACSAVAGSRDGQLRRRWRRGLEMESLCLNTTGAKTHSLVVRSTLRAPSWRPQPLLSTRVRRRPTLARQSRFPAR